jgi:hypothetical protein
MAFTSAGILPLCLHLTMPRRLITTYALLGRGQAPPPPPPPPSADIPEEEDDLYFEDDDDEEEENPELAEEPEATEEAKAEDDDSNDFAFLDNPPDPKEKAVEQRALLASFESAKEANDAARARALELSVQRAPTEDAGRRLFTEEQQRLLEDVTER